MGPIEWVGKGRGADGQNAALRGCWKARGPTPTHPSRPRYYGSDYQWDTGVG